MKITQMIDIKIIMSIVLVSGILSIGTVYAVTSNLGPINMSGTDSVFWGNNGSSIAQTNSTGNGTGSFLTLRGFSGIIMKNLGTGAFGTGNEITRIDPTGIVMANGKSFSWGDLGISVSRTDTTGAVFGNYLNERGFDGILFRTGGSGTYGTGNEITRINPTGIVMANGKSFSWGDLGISISRTDTTGAVFGNFLNERGFDGIIFRTGGTSAYGTGVEDMRITPAGNVGIGTSTPTQKLDVSGNIRLTGNMTATPANQFSITTTNGKDICIGAC